MKTRQVILESEAIGRKLDRMAYEIFENNYEEEELHFIGIRENGFSIAQMLAEKVKVISKVHVTVNGMSLNKKNPVNSKVFLDDSNINLSGKTIILVDDVAQSGRTLLYAIKPLLDFGPSKIEVAVLVDRKHKKYPVTADYVGTLLSTAIGEQVILELEPLVAYLE